MRRVVLVLVFLYLASVGAAPLFAAVPASSICLPEDNQTCLLLSPLAAQELLKANNSYGDDIQLSLERVPSEEVHKTLRAIRITAETVSGHQPVTDFSFKNPVELRLGHWTLFQHAPQAAAGQPPAGAGGPVGDVRQWLSVYWHNGQSLVRLGGLFLDASLTLFLSVRNLGYYQIAVSQPAAALQLSRGSPYPRILTPQGRYNRRVFFFIDNTGPDPITGTIYDLQGSKVRELEVDGLSPAPNALVWDGRDGSGNVVPSGPYFYRISSGGQNISGTLAVAR